MSEDSKTLNFPVDPHTVVTPPGFSEETKLRALVLALTDANAKMQRELAFYKEFADGGPAKYVFQHNYDPEYFGERVLMPFDHKDPNDCPTTILLDEWYKEVASRGEDAYYNDSELGYDHDLCAASYAAATTILIESMIKKVRNSCMNIGAIRTVVIGECMHKERIAKKHNLTCAAIEELLHLFTDAEIVISLFPGPDDPDELPPPLI